MPRKFHQTDTTKKENTQDYAFEVGTIFSVYDVSADQTARFEYGLSPDLRIAPVKFHIISPFDTALGRWNKMSQRID